MHMPQLYMEIKIEYICVLWIEQTDNMLCVPALLIQYSSHFL